MGQLTTIKNDALMTAKKELDTAQDAYLDAGIAFVADLTKALADMQGETKDAITEFIEKTITPFVNDSVPSAIQGCSKLLEGNRDAFEKMDIELANALRGL